MSSAFDYANTADKLVISPHVETAIWAIIAALACVLVVIIDDMVKHAKAAHAPSNRNRPKPPGRRR